MRSTYQRLNNVFGILMFIVTASVYCLTIEPTASLWDCGEFIVSAYKLEVGHPPGAPFFMLTANVFTQFTGDTMLAARMVNYMSALMSAATIMLLFWTITHLTGKLIVKDQESVTRRELLIIIACGITGALVYTFSDTFWFSAVEGEVYAYSSLFTALVFWLILKWEKVADEPHSDRWLILIAYLTGLSIGVHILNLLCLPAIALVYFHKRKPDSSLRETIPALIISMVLVAIVLYGIIPGVVKVGGWFELLFVNKLELPFNTGLIIYVIALAGCLIWGIYETYTERNTFRMKLSFLMNLVLLGIPFYGHGGSSILIGGIVIAILIFYLFAGSIKPQYKPSARILNTTLLCFLMIMAGYSSYALIVIRSSANTPMDQYSPEDIFTLGSYLGREHYGNRPLFYGHTYSSERQLKVEDGYCTYDLIQGAPIYTRKEKDFSHEKDSYIVSGYFNEYRYAQNMLFPRMYSSDHASYGPGQVNLYKQWVDIEGHNVSYDRCGEAVMVNIPTQWENLKFFFSYQLNFMYWRYFLWNFAGRQNDIQGHGELEHGNWLTGITLIDNLLIGNQHAVPKELKNNKGHNVYYCLPLLLGIIGLLWQIKRGKPGIKSFQIVFFLFFMTGIAIIIYLNQTPMQARERDYAYSGSFYAFAIWIGMGVAGLACLLQKMKLNKTLAGLIAPLTGLLIPIQMASQTWDDHDRSNRFSCRDIGYNYLMSTPESDNPIIFNQGDNDTFPLWYNQEVEGVRTDVRTCNFGYLQTDWYIDQMKRPAYDSPALPISWKRKEYISGSSEYVFIRPELKGQIDTYYQIDPAKAKQDFGDNPYELKNILRHWVRSEREQMRVIPTDSIVIKLDKEAIYRSGMMIPDSLYGVIPEYMNISLKNKKALTKNELMLLEIVAVCNWERPVFTTTTVSPEVYSCFKENLCQEGLLYRITPFNTHKLNARMDSEKTYDYLMNRFRWGGIENPTVYMDENVLRLYAGSRKIFASLAKQLLEEKKNSKALEVLDHCTKVIPDFNLPYDYHNGAVTLAESYYLLGEKIKADRIINILASKSIEYLNWYQGMNESQRQISTDNYRYHLYLLDKENMLMEKYNSELFGYYSSQFEKFYRQIDRFTE